MSTPILKISPSKLGLIAGCAAAALRSAPYPFTETEASKRGKELHKRIALLIQKNPSHDQFEEVFEVVCAGLDDKDRKAIRLCWDVYQEQMLPAGKFLIQIEDKIQLFELGMERGGIPDLIIYDIDSKTLTVVDWKFGGGLVSDPEENKQLHAYAVGVTRDLGAHGYQVDRAYLVIVQPSDTPSESYRDFVVEAVKFPEMTKAIRSWVDAARAPSPKATPGPHCRGQFCEAARHDACAEYAAWKDAKETAAEETKVAAAAYAVSGVNAIVVDGPIPLFPIVVFSEEAVARAKDLRDRIFALQVVDQATADQMGLLVAEATKFEGQIDKNRMVVKRPILDLGDKIDAESKRGLIPVREGKGEGNIRLTNWKAEDNKRREALAREAEAKRRAEEEKLRKAEEDRLRAQREEEEAARKASEAKTKKAREAALIAQAEAANRKKAAEALEQKAQATLAIPTPEIQEPAQVQGVRFNKVPEYRIVDEAQVPRHLLVVNEPLLKKSIETNGWGKDGKACPAWIEVKWVEKSQSKGGR